MIIAQEDKITYNDFTQFVFTNIYIQINGHVTALSARKDTARHGQGSVKNEFLVKILKATATSAAVTALEAVTKYEVVVQDNCPPKNQRKGTE